MFYLHKFVNQLLLNEVCTKSSKYKNIRVHRVLSSQQLGSNELQKWQLPINKLSILMKRDRYLYRVNRNTTTIGQCTRHSVTSIKILNHLSRNYNKRQRVIVTITIIIIIGQHKDNYTTTDDKT